MNAFVAAVISIGIGAIVGLLWIKVSPSTERQGGPANVVVGAVAGGIGGMLGRAAFGMDELTRIIFSVPIALLSAVLALFALKGLIGRRSLQR